MSAYRVIRPLKVRNLSFVGVGLRQGGYLRLSSPTVATGGHALFTLDGGGSSRRAVMQVTELRDGMGLHGLEGMDTFRSGGRV
jgi:hypothetical protein